MPTAISVPGAELVYRFADLMPSPDTMVIVNCGGRTRSIIGAQSLISAGVPNKVVSLKDGTMAWHLAGLEVVHGASRKPPEVSAHGLQSATGTALRVAARCGIARIYRIDGAANRFQVGPVECPARAHPVMMRFGRRLFELHDHINGGIRIESAKVVSKLSMIREHKIRTDQCDAYCISDFHVFDESMRSAISNQLQYQ